MKGITNYIIIALLLVLIGLTLRNNKQEIDFNTALAEQKLDAIPVKTTTVEKKQVTRRLPLAGIITAEQNLMLMAQAQGRVIRTLVSEGETVSAGDIIAIIDDSYLLSEKEVLTASLEKLSKDLERYKVLAQNKAITNQQLEGAQLQYDNVKTQYDILLKRLADTRVKSPIDGLVSKLLVNKGTMVGSGVPIAQILNQSSFSIQFSVNEQEVIKLEAGQTVGLTDIGFENISGAVSKVSLSKNRMGKYEVEATLSGYENTPLKSDMVRSAEVIISDTTAHLLVPANAVVYNESQRGVYKVGQDRVSFVPLAISDMVGDLFIVEGGLKKGDQIVSEGQYRVTDGSEIKLIQ
ncbi:MAG: efflux RND transporter periplasmic adaptor subunit [Cyclobacteriaceae bacterium]